MNATRTLIRPTAHALRTGTVKPALFHTSRVVRDGKTVEATSQNFADLVEKADKPVIVDFYADWCGPCKMLGPILTKAVADNKKVTLVKVDVDESTDIAAKYQIAAMPTVFAFHKGKVVDQFVGMRDKKFLTQFVNNHGDRQ
ncbi:hypothetical protein NQZ79_g2785 [Umbelopsis isabellina]|nr:hypothetical protein NQZ79_g2785 [Umbelopsis isabellina]